MLRFVVWELSTILRTAGGKVPSVGGRRRQLVAAILSDGATAISLSQLCAALSAGIYFFVLLPRYTRPPRIRKSRESDLVAYGKPRSFCCDLLQYDPRLVATDVLPRRRHSIPEMPLAAAACIKLSSRRTRLTQSSTSCHILPSEPAHAALTTPEICRLNRRWRISVW
jgi:hypothetical protein